MKNYLAMIAAVALVAVGFNTLNTAVAAPPTAAVQQAIAAEALAASKWQALVWANDGGSSIGYCVNSTNQTIQLQSFNATEYCYRPCATTTCVADCTKDFRPMLVTIAPQWPGDSGVIMQLATGKIQMGADKCIAARALDAGNPALQLFLETGNN